MSEFKKLFRVKRILAVLLAVATVVTSGPATANAAPLESQAEAGQAEEDASAAEGADGEQSDEEQTAPSDEENEQEDTSVISQESGDDSNAEDDTELESGEAEESAALETVDPEETEKEYVFRIDEFLSDYTTAQYCLGEALFATEIEAADGIDASMTVKASVLRYITLQNVKDESDSYNLQYNSNADLVKALTYVWKQDGKELGQGKSPRESGTYQLVIKLEPKEGEYKAAETTIDFQITKAKVDIDFSVPNVNPGNTASDVVLNYAAVTASDGNEFICQIDDKDTDADEASDNEVSLDIVVKEAATNNVLQSGDKLIKNKEYVVNVIPKFIGENSENYAKNYEFNQPDEQNIVVNDLIKTRIKLTLDTKYDNAQYKKESTISAKDPEQKIDKITIKSYDGSAIAAIEPQFTAEVGVPGIDQDEQETFDVIQGAEIKKTWHSAVYESWTEGETNYCNLTVGGELEGVPVEAGVYVYRAAYEGDGQQYAASNADIVVEIESVALIVQPKFDTAVKSFYDGQTVADVLAEVGYELPYADDIEKNFIIPEDKKDCFWGTSYVNSTVTQPYEPVFEVVKTVVNTENGVSTSETVILDEEDLLKFDENGMTSYEVRFTGYKAVYYADGTEYTRKAINTLADSTNNNYFVKEDRETLEKYTVQFEVKNVNARIDTSAVIAGLTTNQDFYDAAGKTYDGTKLFANRAEYKKAQLKSIDTSTVVAGVSSTDLTYKWYSSSYKTIMDTKVPDGNGKFIECEDFQDSFSERNDLISPIDAGIYKLVITYQDREGKYFAEPAEVYFVIEKQKLQIKLTDKVYTEFSDITAGQFLNDTDIEYSIEPEFTKPAAGEEWKKYDSSYSNYPFTYTVIWQVEEKQRDADGNALKDEAGNDIYSPLQSYESFVYDSRNFADSYRLSVKSFSCYNSNYTVTETVIENAADPADPNAVSAQNKVTRNLSISNENTAEISVKKMGSTEIRMDMDGVIEKEKDYNGVSIYDVLKDDLAKIKLVKDNADGTTTEVTDVPLTYMVTETYMDDDTYMDKVKIYELSELSEDEFSFWVQEDGLLNGGNYEISVQYRGDETYAPIAETVIARVTVNAIPITITPPVLEDAIVAGTTASDVSYKAHNAFGADNIDGYLDRDQYYFSLNNLYYNMDGYVRYYGMGYPAWFYDYPEDNYRYWLPYFWVMDTEEQERLDYDDIIKGNDQDRYKLIMDDAANGGPATGFGELFGRCARNYYLVPGEPAPVSVVRGNASLQAVQYGNILDVDTTDSITGMTHRFKVLDGIQYTSFGDKEGNFVAIEITAPNEYVYDTIWERAVYKTSIQEAGGVIAANNGNAITVVFDAAKGYTEFGIRWEEDYVETFKLEFSENNCLGNLDDAVSPKSIVFNAPNKTMVVGATQDLDVKITKVQKDDVICLGYEVTKGQEYLCVNEYGKVTTLKAGGSATVTVYPMHLVNGVKTPIDDPKAKKASVTITVKDVAAPKISKVTSSDYGMTLQYPYVQNVDDNYGYRREIYVLEGKNLKEQDFKDKIDAMSNEQWEGIFAVEPVFLNSSQEYSSRVYDSKKHSYMNMVEYVIGDLKPNTDYTVYVRNVSAVRTLSDGCQVTKSAAGSVKGFTTTKSQVKDLEAVLKDREETNKNGEIGNGSLEWISYQDVKLSEGSVQLQVKGYYEAWAMDESAEPIDKDGGFDIDGNQPLLLPLSKEYQKYYVSPKISYYFRTWTNKEGCYDAYTGEKVEPYRYYWSAASDYASVDKKGKLTLKQPGYVTIAAVDTTTGVWSNPVNISISASADKIKGKTTTLQVGQSLRLENLIVYSEGKKVLDQNCYNTSGRIDRNGLKEQIEKGGYFEFSDDGYITAIKGKGNIKVTLTDKLLNKSVQVTIKSTDLAPVKNLKAIDVIDNRFTVQFETNPYAEAYRIDVKNARGGLIRSIYAENSNDGDDDYRQGNWHIYFDGKTGKRYGEYTMNGLTQQSKYTVTVQALYKDNVSKAVSKSVTTTKLPASEKNLAENETGGITIYVWNYSGYTIDQHPFISGNEYTLIAVPDNLGAKYAATDTLIWSSSNKKAATVKAKAGSYSATLKAVKNGDTTIEVKSKITKKVVARYEISIRNVGDAYSVNAYYGDNEDLRGSGNANKPSYTEITLGNPAAVDLNVGQTKWFAFTAPEKGTYSFYRMMQNGNRSTSGFEVYDDVLDGSYLGGSNVSMNEGQTVYVQAAASGSYTMNVEKQKGIGPSDRTPLEIGTATMQVTYGQYFVFTAEGEGLYRFSGPTFRVEDTESNQKTQGRPAKCWLEDGETVYLCALGSGQWPINVEKIPVTQLTADSDAVFTGEGNENVWFCFNVPADAEYEFELTNYGRITLYCLPDANDQVGQGYRTVSQWLSKGKTILLEVPANNELVVRTKTPVEEIKEGSADTDNMITLSSSYNYFSFTAAETGIYQFFSENADGVNAYLITNLENTNNGSYVDSDSTYSGNFCMDCYLEAGANIYLKLCSNSGVRDNVTIHAVKKTPVQITAEGASVTVAAGLTEWFSFSADAKNTLIFKSEDTSCSRYFYDDLSSAGVMKGSFSNSNSTELYDPLTGTVYYKVKNTSRDMDTTVTVKAKEDIVVPVTTASEATVRIESNLEQWFSFTAEDAADYFFSFGSDAASCTAYYWYSDPAESGYGNSVSLSGGNSRSVTRSLLANETIYLRIKNNGSEDANVTIKAKKKATVPMVNGNVEVELYSGYDSAAAEQVISFTSVEDARYTFYFTSDTSAYAYLYGDENLAANLTNVSFSQIYDDSEDGREIYYSAKKEWYVAEGDTVYWRIRNNDSSSDTIVTVKAEKVPVIAITAEGTGAVSLTSNVDQWFSFTADTDEDARYLFTFTSEPVESSAYSYAYFYRTLDASAQEGSSVSISSSAGSGDERYIPAGQTVYWKMRNSNDATVTVEAHKIEVNEWPADDEAVTIEAASEKWYKFTAADDGRYNFTVKNDRNAYYNAYLYPTLDAATYTSVNVRYTSTNDGNIYVGTTDYYLASNETVYFKIKNTSGAEMSVTLNMEIISSNLWPAEGDEITMEAGSTSWFAYTAPESARYAFSLTSDGNNCRGYLYPSEDADQYAVTISTNSTNVNGTYIYAGTGEYYVEAGTTIYCKVTNESSVSRNITWKAEPITVDGLAAEEAGNIEFDLNTTAAKWASFEVPETGIYRFSVAFDSGSGYLARYENMESTNYTDRISVYSSNSAAALTYSLEKGKTVYLRVSPSGTSFKGTLQAEMVSGVQTLGLDSAMEVSVDTDVAKYQLLEFTAEEDGNYRFYSEGDDNPKAWFFEDMDINYTSSYSTMNSLSKFNDDNSGTDNNFSKKIAMTAGQTIYVAVGHPYLNTNITTTVYVENTGIVKTTPLTLDEGAGLDVSTGEYRWYSFIAPADGDYIFYSDNNSDDTKAWFFRDTSIGNDAVSGELDTASNSYGYGYDDDDNDNLMQIGNRNFAKKISMLEGETVYVAVGRYGLNGPVTAVIHVINDGTDN